MKQTNNSVSINENNAYFFVAGVHTIIIFIETDILYLQFTEAEIYESDEEKPGMIIDYDLKGDIVGIEYLNASTKIENPSQIQYDVVG